MSSRALDLRREVGGIDIYLLDQILRGNIPDDATVLDAGCGGGRNLHYFLRRGHSVFGLDADVSAVAQTRTLAESFGQGPGEDRFRVEDLAATTFERESFDLVICNAVLHFARDEHHFRAMVDSLAGLTRKGGICFCRLASDIGIETEVQPLGPPHDPRWHRLPDGSDRFLVDLELLLRETERIGVDLVDPLKTVNVQGLRCMTNWVWRKP